MKLNGATTDKLNIVVGTKPARVDGSLVGKDNQPLEGRDVVLVPDEHRERLDLYRRVSSGPQGSFSIQGIPPGNYEIYAWDGLEPFAYFDVEFLKGIEGTGVPVRLEESGVEKIRLKGN
jgi:hypothetical protein